LALLTERLLGRPKTVASAQWRMMAPVTAISAFLNNTPVVAMFIPVVRDWSKKMGFSPSKLLIPLSYAAILGGTCTLIGTSTNLVVQGMILESMKITPGLHPMGMFTITAVGLPAAIVGVLYLVIFGRWILPDRATAEAQMADPRQYTVEMLVQPASAIDGQSIEKAGLRQLPGAYLIEIERDGETIAAVGPEQILHGGDRLIFAGVVSSVVDLQKIRGLVPATDQVFKLAEPRHNRLLMEAVVSNTCPLVGQTIRQGQFRSRYEAAIIAVHRNGQRLGGKIGDIVLQPGDTLLLEAPAHWHRRHQDNRDFFLVSSVAESRPMRHEKSSWAIGILLVMVLLMTFESVIHISVFNAALLSAAAMLLTRCLSQEQARRSIDWSTLIAIGAAFGIGHAMYTTGLASGVAAVLIGLFSHGGPWMVLLGVYIMTLLFTYLVTHNASAVLAFPIARAAAAALGVNFMPFVIVVAMAASNGYASPLGYTTHLMVYGPGGYRFSDFVKAGLPLDLLVMAVTVGITPLVFPFHYSAEFPAGEKVLR
jgi:di/tricarboxylate transporter